MKPRRRDTESEPKETGNRIAEPCPSGAATTPSLSAPVSNAKSLGRASGWAGLCLILLGLPVLLCGCDGRKGKLVSGTVSAASLSTNVMRVSSNQQVVVYLPPAYAHSNRRFPVLYFLPNFDHNLWRYTGGSFQGFRLKDALDRGIQRGDLQQMIVVVPNVNHWLGGSWYRNSVLTGNWEDFIVQDLTGYIDSHFRTIPSARSRALAGHGMGGFGALELGLKHPDLFGVIYALSPTLFDHTGLQDFGILKDNLLATWHSHFEKWRHARPNEARWAFRDFLQTRLNSPVRASFIEGLCISYAAAVSPDLALPYPHIAFPELGTRNSRSIELAAKFESGFGDWEHKLDKYQARGRGLSAITIEHGGNGEYDWIRRGASHVSNLMRERGIPHTLAAHAGGHDSGLGERLEGAMLPVISKSLGGEREQSAHQERTR